MDELQVPDLPETVVDRLHRTITKAGGRYEEWRVGARRSQGVRPQTVFAERVDPTTAALVVDHLRRCGAQDDGLAGPDADEVFLYRPEAWRHPTVEGTPVAHEYEAQ